MKLSQALRLKRAKELSKQLIEGVEILEMIRNMGYLTPLYTNVTAGSIAELTSVIRPEIVVKTYKQNWFKYIGMKILGKRVLAYVTRGSNALYINERHLNRSTESLVGSIVHEWGHLLEREVKWTKDDGIEFNHGNNNPKGKENTFQYKLGRLAKAWARTRV